MVVDDWKEEKIMIKKNKLTLFIHAQDNTVCCCLLVLNDLMMYYKIVLYCINIYTGCEGCLCGFLKH